MYYNLQSASTNFFSTFFSTLLKCIIKLNIIKITHLEFSVHTQLSVISLLLLMVIKKQKKKYSIKTFFDYIRKKITRVIIIIIKHWRL